MIILTILSRLKIVECRKIEMYDIGFINTNLIDKFEVEKNADDAEANLLKSLIVNRNKDKILFPLQLRVSVTVLCIFSFPYILVQVIVM